jgi:ABC-type glycerol-3-phosphate transport system substrate-binding protein
VKKILIINLFVSLIIGMSIFVNSYNVSAENSDFDNVKLESLISENQSYIDAYDNSESYYGVYNAWMDISENMPTQVYTIVPTDYNGNNFVNATNSQGYNKTVLELHPNEIFSMDVTVENEGLYEIYFDYYLLPETKLRPSISIKINDQFQYNEMANIEVPIQWKVDENQIFDRFGDEMTPNSYLTSKWDHFALSDPNHFFLEPLKFYLKEGENNIEIQSNEGYFLFGDATIGNVYQKPMSYSDYQVNNQGKSDDVSPLVIQAERYQYESKQNIRAKFVRNPSVTPYSYKNRVLNVLDQTSYRKSGDAVTYEFDVEQSGLYELTFKYLQSENTELASYRTIYIDGKVPFSELNSYAFPYKRSWDFMTLHDENGTPYQFYLEAGTHTMTLAVVNSTIKDVYHELLDILDRIDVLSKEINRLTGGLTDRYRDYKLDVYIPTIVDDLKGIKNDLDQAKEQISIIYGSDSLAIINEFNLADRYLNQFIEDPDEIPPFKSRFNEGETSIYGIINTNLPFLIDSPLQLDEIVFHGSDYDLGSANVSIFTRSWGNLRAFFYSFFDPKYNVSQNVDDDTVEIWVRQSRLYIQIMQRMIDEEFTPQSGIKVQLSVMPDEQKIVLANAAKTTPDAAMGLSVTRPFEFALRGMLVDLRQLDGFYDVTSEFNPNSFIPFVYEDGVYSIPETMDVKLLFYRKDVLDFLGVEPPQTWDEVVSLIPLMQKYNYFFYTPLGGDNSFKTFGETTPFIYQHHGEIYNSTGDKAILNEDGAYDAFEFMTDLFSVYNVPITTSNFFQKFRDGLAPIGIGDGNTYIQLKYAAPELAGQWGVMPIPGVEYTYDDPSDCPGPLTDDRCIERWDPTYGVSSVIFKDSTKVDKTWEYFKWWFSSPVQSDFTYQLQSLLGDEFLHMTANIEAFKTSAWPSDSKYEILEQWQWIRTVGKVPGDYLVERELSNAWNRVVNDGVNARVAIDDSVLIMNRELKRKLEEFGYYQDGNLVKPFIIPTYKNINDWLTPGGDGQ